MLALARGHARRQAEAPRSRDDSARRTRARAPNFAEGGSRTVWLREKSFTSALINKHEYTAGKWYMKGVYRFIQGRGMRRRSSRIQQDIAGIQRSHERDP